MYKKFFLKLTRDLLIALTATYFLLLIPELVLPGMVSSHFNPNYLLAVILILGLLFAKFGGVPRRAENLKFQAISRNLINIILFITAVMLVLSLYKMKVWEIAVVVVIAVPLLISAENILIKEK